MGIYLFATHDEKFGMGKNGLIPWTSPGDLQFFYKLTYDQVVVMDEEVYLSIKKRKILKTNPLMPGRICIVISKTLKSAPGASILRSWANFRFWRKMMFGNKQIFIIGGADLFRDTIDEAIGAYCTTIPGNYNCDVFFPFTHEDMLSHGLVLANNMTASQRMSYPQHIPSKVGDVERTIRLYCREEIVRSFTPA